MWVRVYLMAYIRIMSNTKGEVIDSSASSHSYHNWSAPLEATLTLWTVIDNHKVNVFRVSIFELPYRVTLLCVHCQIHLYLICIGSN
jgi:hypothetical protein